jgi:hypothetical protein
MVNDQEQMLPGLLSGKVKSQYVSETRGQKCLRHWQSDRKVSGSWSEEAFPEPEFERRHGLDGLFATGRLGKGPTRQLKYRFICSSKSQFPHNNY